MDYLEESFWRQQFFDSPSFRDALASSLVNGVVRRLQELAEIAVRHILEQDASFEGNPVYSPERAYRVGDILNFLSPRAVRPGLVVHVEPGRSTFLGGAVVPFDGIYVRFKDQTDSAVGCLHDHDFHGLSLYVSNCPSFPTRFTYDPLSHGAALQRQIVTPGQLVMKFDKIIIPSLKEALAADPRFCTFDGEEWILIPFLRYFDEPVTRKTISELRESGGILAEKLGELVCGPNETQRAGHQTDSA